MMTRFVKAVAVVYAVCASGFVVHAVSPEELADRIEATHAEQLRDVDRIRITSEISTGMMEGMTSTGSYIKQVEEGRPLLREVEEDDVGTMNLAGLHDGTLPKMVRHARSIERGRLDSERVYIIVVDDVEFLKSLDELSFDDDMIDDEFEPKSVTVWLAASDYTTPQPAEEREWVDAPAVGREDI